MQKSNKRIFWWGLGVFLFLMIINTAIGTSFWLEKDDSDQQNAIGETMVYSALIYLILGGAAQLLALPLLYPFKKLVEKA